MKTDRKGKRAMGTALLILAAVILIGLAGDLFVVLKTKNRVPADGLQNAGGKYDCILVLGCAVDDSGMPKQMLRNRLDRAIELYDKGISDKLLMSGDHGSREYDEVGAMKAYAVEKGVPSEDIFMDHAGFSTYETMYRASAVFGVRSAVIVSQEYHLYRAVFDAVAFGIDAVGISAEGAVSAKQFIRDIREIIARNKDLVFCILKPRPKFLGEIFPISGNGDLTND